jgi:ribosomal protein S12 methylthiotransferase
MRTRDLPVFPVTPDPVRADVPRDVAAVRLDIDGVGPETGPRFGLITLGCDKNTVDSERMLAALVGAGAHVSSDLADAEVIVINTCGFIEAAKEESIETVLEACALKTTGKVRAVVGVGCLVQRYKDELVSEIPEVDLFLGLAEMGGLLDELRLRGLLPTEPPAVPNMERPLRILSTETPHTSFLKISEGCDHTCAFCAIPLMRGLHRSAPLEELVAEARALGERGVQELNVISQDTTWYGRDLRRGPQGREAPLLPDLLRALVAETSVPWYRLFYMYPSGITRELVELLASEPRIVPYLDMPLQHGSDRVLSAMRRPERRASILERVGWLREAIPDLTLRTTLIVGFPDETDEDFRQMLDLLDEIRFQHVGAFTYSVEEGTRAAAMEAQVPATLKRERLEELQDHQRAISLERNRERVGRSEKVLVDRTGPTAGRGAGRTAGQALDIDGLTHLTGLAAGQAGRFVRVEITDAGEHDLEGAVSPEDQGGLGP